MVKISIFIKESAYELIFLMSSHTDQVERRVDEPFQQFRHYGTSLLGKKWAKTGINNVKKSCFRINFSTYLHIKSIFALKSPGNSNKWLQK